MEQNYKHIDWSKYPKRVTDLGDMNNNKLDIAIDDVDQYTATLNRNGKSICVDGVVKS